MSIFHNCLNYLSNLLEITYCSNNKFLLAEPSPCSQSGVRGRTYRGTNFSCQVLCNFALQTQSARVRLHLSARFACIRKNGVAATGNNKDQLRKRLFLVAGRSDDFLFLNTYLAKML